MRGSLESQKFYYHAGGNLCIRFVYRATRGISCFVCRCTSQIYNSLLEKYHYHYDNILCSKSYTVTKSGISPLRKLGSLRNLRLMLTKFQQHWCSTFSTFLSCYWPDFDQTFNVGSWEHLEHIYKMCNKHFELY